MRLHAIARARYGAVRLAFIPNGVLFAVGRELRDGEIAQCRGRGRGARRGVGVTGAAGVVPAVPPLPEHAHCVNDPNAAKEGIPYTFAPWLPEIANSSTR